MNSTSFSLLERVKQPGDGLAWSRFVELYTPLLYYWGRRAGLQEPDAADLVQDVLSLLLQKLPEFTYDRQKTFRGWLRTVTLNKWREKNRRRAVSLLEANGERLEELAAPEDSEVFWEVEYQQFLVQRALEVMKESFEESSWKACWEFVVAGRPAEEVARDLGISEGAVYIAKSRVLKRLREELSGLLE